MFENIGNVTISGPQFNLTGQLSRHVCKQYQVTLTSRLNFFWTNRHTLDNSRHYICVYNNVEMNML
jgi:hypothetical protein